MDEILSVFNESINKILYLKGSEEYTGLILENVLSFDRWVQNAKKTDVLYIIFIIFFRNGT